MIPGWGGRPCLEEFLQLNGNRLGIGDDLTLLCELYGVNVQLFEKFYTVIRII